MLFSAWNIGVFFEKERENMLFSFGILLIAGAFAGKFCEKIKLPALLGMLVSGMIIGPFGLNWIDPQILDLSSVLQKIALIIILIRAGLNLNIDDLKKIGRPAFLMCFVPATFEIAATTLIAPLLFDMSYVDAALTGCVLGAVSPAVIIPHMIQIMKEGYGANKSVPQMILAGSSMDDIFVIVLFSILLTMETSHTADLALLLRIPTSILLGILGGFLSAFLMKKVFQLFSFSISEKVVLYLSVCFLLAAIEDWMTGNIAFSGLVAIMVSGMVFQKLDLSCSMELADRFASLWTAAQIVLFVLVGAIIDFSFAIDHLGSAILLIVAALCFRSLGVFVCLSRTNLSVKEKAFCILSYFPKATVQAAIGAIPLSLGLVCGPLVLTIAACAIVLTAPLGSFLISHSYKRCLSDKDAV